MSKTLEMLELAVKNTEASYHAAILELEKFKSLPENNVYETLEKASLEIEDILLQEAHNDCVGSYNCGNKQYTKEFMVGSIIYVGTIDVEYNRHDKQYYYVEEHTFSTAVKTGE